MRLQVSSSKTKTASNNEGLYGRPVPSLAARKRSMPNASMVFIGNINQSVDAILKTSHLFEPFPDAMSNDTAFFDRMHYYLARLGDS